MGLFDQSLTVVPYSNIPRFTSLGDCSGYVQHIITSEEYNKIMKRLRSDTDGDRCNLKPRTAFNKYAPKKIIYNGKATIVFWIDGTKTVVKKADEEPYNRYNAFCAALAKKIFGNNSAVNRFVKSGIEQE